MTDNPAEPSMSATDELNAGNDAADGLGADGLAAEAFDTADLDLLLERYRAPVAADQARRTPWTWSVLTGRERQALTRLINVYVTTYNHTSAITPSELVPPCWPEHHALAAELAVQVWLWYFCHQDPAATPLTAAEFHRVHLPAFRSGLTRLLGISPSECQHGQHPSSWRRDADTLIATYADSPQQTDTDTEITLLGAMHFGFPHPDHGPL